MTVKELKELLKDCDDNDIVIMSSDAEGNSFSPLADIGEDMYTADSTWSGEIHMRAENVTEELRKQGYSDEDIRTEEDGAVKCITLYPTN